MSFNFDIDEADVAVLTQNLTKSKELFSSISKSLNKISTKSGTASKKIKPVLKQVNRLNESKTDIESGLNLVAEVQQYASQAAQFESILNSPIEQNGLKKYLSTLIQSKKLLKEMKSNVGGFKGVLVNFQNSIEKSEYSLVTYFRRNLLKDGDVNLAKYVKPNQDAIGPGGQQAPGTAGAPLAPAQISTVKLKEIAFTFDYFHNLNPDDKSLDQAYIQQRSSYLVQAIGSIENITTPASKTNKQIPYERGSNGINIYSKILCRLIEQESQQLNEINEKLGREKIDVNSYLFDILGKTLNEVYSSQILKIMKYVEAHMQTDSLLALETVVCVKEVEMTVFKVITATGITTNFKQFLGSYFNLKKLCQTIFFDLLKFIESKITALEKLPNDNGVSEVTVDLMSRIRKVSDFRESCLEIVSTMKLGSWMMQTPKPKSMSVFSSVLPNAEVQDEHDASFLLSSYFSDCIDSILINLEIITKSGELRIAKKSVQGYFLITNLTLVEQIINRSSELYKSLGSIGLERLSKLKKRFLVLFLDDWNYASYIIIRDMTTITATHAATTSTNSSGNAVAAAAAPSSSGSLNNKEKEQIKELFKTFNESFEDAVSNYKNFNITDQNLRAYLTNEIKKLIMNTYFKLYDKYGTVDFTKNKSKYVKYDKKSFEDVLNNTL
ncbi:exocyst complex protein Exo70p [[Candida] railenensis]|uniref:Exocyst complex protein EXO70 n=1 Tax=[Candida] railenensis TaxID=45579 RepID=A0A9P0QMY6_9ASCO|nr:exocyst complex protein Exo70p [[Candida] railenensis]